MDLTELQIIGTALGQHGPYTFYKAFKYDKDGIKRIVKLGDFFFVKLWSDSDLVCIGELILLWYDRNSEQVLSSLRLYFLPENTPEGRVDEHGEDELLAIAEKVVLRVEDLVTWITLEAEWTWGRLAPFNAADSKENYKPAVRLTDRNIDFKDVDKEKEILMQEEPDNTKGPSVIILSFPQYCRYRAVMKQVEDADDHLKTMVARLLGGISAMNDNTRVLFCRDTFDYPELEGHELLCNHLSPKLTGRPRGRRKKRSLSPCSDSNESECSVSNAYNVAQAAQSQARLTEDVPNSDQTTGMCTRRSSRLVVCNSESKEFLKKLTDFMKLNDTPMGRIPSLGYKELDLHAFFTRVDKLGGYEAVTTNRLWKSIFDDLSGNYLSTSAATVIRRHYERFLLPYELYLKGEEFHPSILKSTIRRTKNHSHSFSEADINDNNTSSTVVSGTSSCTAISDVAASTSSQLTIIPLPSTAVNSSHNSKDPQDKLKTETKPSSLRSVRVKPDRLKDAIPSTSKESGKSDFTIFKSGSPTHLTTEIVNGLSVELIKPIKIEDGKTFPRLSPEVPHTSISFSKPLQEKLIPVYNSSTDVKLTEVPSSIIKSEPEVKVNGIIKTNSFSNSLLSSVKKRKLDILKEGGLEVTPVKQSAAELKHGKVNRSVIHPNSTMPKATIGQLSITLTSDKPKEKLKLTPAFVYGNSEQSPPKVLQSRSIYSHSERTVYGNPKEYFTPPAPHTPSFVNPAMRQTGGDILDLTFKSPQKPMFEMMQLPMESPKKISRPNFDISPRVGSNLEITLVPPTTKPKQNYGSKRLTHPQHRKQPQNGTKLLQNYESREHRPPSSYNGHAAPRPQAAPVKSYANSHSAVPNMYSQLSLANKMLPPYVPTMDPLYLTALQSLYPHGQPFMPIPTPEQIQFYTELMARNSHLSRYPFPYPQDIKNAQPIAGLNAETLKK